MPKKPPASTPEPGGGQPPHHRRIFCNRTLNLRAIRAIGYDMDYTLVHYRIEEWERRAYDHVKRKLLQLGWPIDGLDFDPELIVRGLIVDVERGNILKANRFGYVKQAYHGTRPMPFELQRKAYSRTLVDLNEARFQFLNTLFSLSEACLWAQLVDLLDDGGLPGVMGYPELFDQVRTSIDEAHMEGELKAEIVADPDRFIERDPDAPLALLDQRKAGKKLLLITNSEWAYTFDEFLPAGTTWRDLFDLVIVSARKPAFFSQRSPIFRIVDDEGLLRPSRTGIPERGTFLGGHAGLVEDYLGCSGDEILYVGDHIFTDVHVSKSILRWRTALVLRELEGDFAAAEAFEPTQRRLTELMSRKERLEFEQCQLRLAIQRTRGRYGPAADEAPRGLERRLGAIRDRLKGLDDEIAPLASQSGRLNNERWGPLMRAGNDKSHLARQVERYADIYTSRVSNFLFQTPFVYLRSHRGSLPHDPEPDAAGAGA